MTARRRSGVTEGRLLYAASRGDRQARADLDAIAAERAAELAAELAAEHTGPPPEQPRTPKPDPSQGARGTPIPGTTGVDEGRAMFHARGRRPTYDAI